MKTLQKEYKNFKEKTYTKLQFSYNDFIETLSKINTTKFNLQKIGKSYLGKDLTLIKIGQGKTKILMWSQMHGNEPISTQALADLINFFNQNNKFNKLKKNILQKCTLYLFPLVNPDGLEKFSRRNAQNIDINRDAIKLTSPEALTLHNTIKKIKPNFAFNLHDQERYYGTKNSKHPTAISFLAPTYNTEKTIDTARKKSMQLIAAINKTISNKLSGKTARYTDTHMPEAFGDNTQKNKISTILIEAGYIKNDENRQKVRKYYTISLITALINITEKKYKNYKIKQYKKIPINQKNKFYDYIFKNINIKQNKKKFTTDIAINRKKTNPEKFTDLEKNLIITDIGDLKQKNAFKTINAKKQTLNKIPNKQQKVKITKKEQILKIL